MRRACLLLALVMAGCSRHPSYGTVRPQDTRKPQPRPTYQEPKPGENPAK